MLVENVLFCYAKHQLASGFDKHHPLDMLPRNVIGELSAVVMELKLRAKSSLVDSLWRGNQDIMSVLLMNQSTMRFVVVAIDNLRWFDSNSFLTR